MVTTPATKSTAVQMSHKGSWPGSAAQFPVLPAADFVVWGWQLEEGKFPSSYIPTQESAVTRKIDQVVFAASDVPAWLRTGKWQIDVLPLYSSAEIATTDEFVLMAWEGGQLSLAKDATGGLIKLVSGTTTAKRTIGWARNTKLTLTVDATAKTLQVFGATTGDGSQSYGSIAIATGRVGAGALLDGSKPAFARISEPRKVVSATLACVPDTDCVFCGDGIVTAPPEVCDPGRNARCNNDCSAETGLTGEDPNGNCPPGQVRGVDNGAFFGLERELDLCWPTICTPSQAQNCGSATSICGYCLCVPNCAGKACGDNLDDGCGGTCEVTCSPGQCGCTMDSQCGSGNRCLIGQGARFGCATSANVCAPEVCDDFYKDASQCGTPGAPCGNPCPQSVASFTSLLCGQDADGLACPNTCAANQACVGGLCINPTIFVNPTLPPDLPALPKAQTPDIGAIPARFEVTPRGTASYAIPIEVPAGYNGMQPKLELRYDSLAGNGYLGQGWTLSGLGLSMIQRCAKTFADDGENSAPRITTDDALCLEGQRLIRVGGDASTIEFRTVPDSFSKIEGHITAVAAAGPTSFTVHSKDGLVYKYGKEEPGCIINSTTANREKGCNNSRIFQEASPTQAFKVRAWALSSVSDRAGNELRVFYSSPGQCNGDAACATEEIRPERIAYSAGGYLNFVYTHGEHGHEPVHS